eukprot:COSAG01_NODE_1330_length_10699_cov_49.561604_12_plen_74_part_00
MVANVMAEVSKKEGSAKMSTTLRASIGSMKEHKLATAVAEAKGIAAANFTFMMGGGDPMAIRGCDTWNHCHRA